MRRGDVRGAASVELVIATPLLMLLIMLAIQFALWAHAAHVTQATANEALAATRIEGGTTRDGRDRAQEILATTGRNIVTGTRVSVTRTPSRATVEIHGTAQGIMPTLFKMPVHAEAAGPVERFYPDTQAR